MGRLDGRVAIVTGAAHGIGRAIALKLAQEGADVVAGDLDDVEIAKTVADVEATGKSCVTVIGDSTEGPVAVSLFDTAVERFGKVDILVNNVGGAVPGHIWELTEDVWDRVIRWNLRSMFLCTRAVVPHMIERGYGRIVNISSGAREGSPWQAAYGGAAPYSTAKAGVHGFTRDVSMELAEKGITVNGVAPGAIATERLRDLFVQNESQELSAKRLTPMRRYGKPSEIADAVAYLASDEASFITGQTLGVSGGR